MPKKDIKSALKGSLIKEAQSIKNRFEKADLVFAEKSDGVDSANSNSESLSTALNSEPEPKVIRDSFTMPQDDYELLSLLKKRAISNGVETNKSEILRAGLKALNEMNDQKFIAQLGEVEKIKTGRKKQTF